MYPCSRTCRLCLRHLPSSSHRVERPARRMQILFFFLWASLPVITAKNRFSAGRRAALPDSARLRGFAVPRLAGGRRGPTTRGLFSASRPAPRPAPPGLRPHIQTEVHHSAGAAGPGQAWHSLAGQRRVTAQIRRGQRQSAALPECCQQRSLVGDGLGRHRPDCYCYCYAVQLAAAPKVPHA